MWDNFFTMLFKLQKKYWCTFFSDCEITCYNCNEPAYKYWCNVYDGYRARCPACDVNWPES